MKKLLCATLLLVCSFSVYAYVQTIEKTGDNSYYVFCSDQSYGTLTIDGSSICAIDNTHQKSAKCSPSWTLREAANYLCR